MEMDVGSAKGRLSGSPRKEGIGLRYWFFEGKGRLHRTVRHTALQQPRRIPRYLMKYRIRSIENIITDNMLMATHGIGRKKVEKRH